MASPIFGTTQALQQGTIQMTAKQKCEAKGWIWDEFLQTCTNPEVKKEVAPKVSLSTPEIYKDKKGEIGGIKLPTGETYLGLKPNEVRKMVEGYQRKTALPEGTALAGTAQRQAEMNQLIQDIGNIPGITPERYQELISNITGQQQFKEGLPGALREGTVSAVSKGVSYGALALGATAATGGAAAFTIPFAIAGGVIQGYWQALAKAKPSEAVEDAGNIMSEFTQLKKGMTTVASGITQGDINPSEATELFNAQYSRMLELKAQLKYLTDTNLKDYLSDASGDLIRVSTYLEQVVPAYKSRMQTGVLNPSTSRIPYSDVFTEGVE